MERFQLSSGQTLSTVSHDVPVHLREMVVAGIARFGSGYPGDLSFCDREPSVTMSSVPAGVVVLCPPSLGDTLNRRFPGAVLVLLADPRSAFIDFCERMVEAGSVSVSDAVLRPFGIHPTARIGANTSIDPEVRVDAGARVGAGCVIHRGVWIQQDAVVADGVMLGSQGMNSYIGHDGRRRGFPHLGSVIVGEGVEIGAGTVVRRGILTSTIIGARSIVGTLCSIGHGVRVAESVWICHGTIIGGHAILEARAALALRVVVRDNVVIGADAQVGMGSVVTKSVDSGTSVFGQPARRVRPFRAAPDH